MKKLSFIKLLSLLVLTSISFNTYAASSFGGKTATILPPGDPGNSIVVATPGDPGNSGTLTDSSDDTINPELRKQLDALPDETREQVIDYLMHQ